VAKWLLDEFTSERKLEKVFANSEDVLSQIADGALGEHRQGKTKPLPQEPE